MEFYISLCITTGPLWIILASPSPWLQPTLMWRRDLLHSSAFPGESTPQLLVKVKWCVLRVWICCRWLLNLFICSTDVSQPPLQCLLSKSIIGAHCSPTQICKNALYHVLTLYLLSVPLIDAPYPKMPVSFLMQIRGFWKPQWWYKLQDRFVLYYTLHVVHESYSKSSCSHCVYLSQCTFDNRASVLFYLQEKQLKVVT